MSRVVLSLVHSILVVLLIMFLSSGLPAQEQNQPATDQNQEQPQEKTEATEQPAEPQNQQKQPPDIPKTQGTLVMPTAAENGEVERSERRTEPADDESGRIYIIRPADTLWDISHAFLKDPFLWPFIWKANPYITDPDLIYPGNRLAIPSMAPIEQALQEQAHRGPSGEAGPALLTKRAPREEAVSPEPDTSGSKLVLPEEGPRPLISKYSMLSAGFISQDESSDLIVGSKAGKTIFGYDDIVYVTIRSKADAVVGDKFIIYQPLNKVKHPISGDVFGRLVKVLGILELTEKGESETYSARITLSFDAAVKGSMLTPYQEPALIYNKDIREKSAPISGYILEVMDTRTINAQTDIVYLDKGSVDGVEAGDRFIVYTKTDREEYPRYSVGEVLVFLVKEHTSTAVVRKSNNTLARGDVVEFRK
jgi:hypothetical protein